MRVPLVAGVLLIGVAAALMYEDEQGQKDWLWEGVGHVTHASIHIGKSLKNVYTLSDGNTVAALRVKSGGDVRWKRVLGRNERLACLAHTDRSVVVGAAGSQALHYFDAKDGQATFSSPLPRLDGELIAMQCAATAHHLLVATAYRKANGSSVVRLYKTSLESGFEADSLLSEHHLQHTVTSLRLEEQATYVETGDGAFSVLNAAGSTLERVAEDRVSAPSSRELLCAVEDSGPVARFETKEIKGLGCLPQEPPAVVGSRLSKEAELVVRTHDGHLHYVVNGAIHWSRPEGLSALTKVSFAEIPKTPSGTESKFQVSPFGFDQRIVAVSRFGRIYSLLTTPANAGAPEWSFDVKVHLYRNYWPQVAVEGTDYEPVSIEAHSDVVKVLIRLRTMAIRITLNSASGELLGSDVIPAFAHLIGGRWELQRGEGGVLRSTVEVDSDTRFFVTDDAAGTATGYFIAKGQRTAVLAWKVALGVPITASATSTSAEAVQTADVIRLFPNASTKQLEVRTKYGEMANLLVLAHFEELPDDPPTLHLTAIDTVTGNVLASLRHANVDARVQIVVAEHAVYYHLLNVKLMRYYLGVWEVFERTDSTVTDATFTNPAQIAVSAFAKQRAVSAFNARPPLIAAQLMMFAHDVLAMGVTVTLDGIARKQALFVTPSGQLAAVDLKQLSFGYHEEGKPDPLTTPMTQVVIPPFNILSYSKVLHKPTAVVSSPSLLESTSHVLVLGQDLFYVRTASGKPFDILNADFARQPLLLVCGGFVIATGLLRYFAQKKSLRSQWE